MEQNSSMLFLQAPQLHQCGTQQIGEGMASVLFFWAENPADYSNASLGIFLAIGVLSVVSLLFGVKPKSE